MPVTFVIIVAAYGALSLLFAFVKPPSFVGALFPVSRFFIFLPDSWIMPVGRVFNGLMMLGASVWMYLKLLPH